MLKFQTVSLWWLNPLIVKSMLFPILPHLQTMWSRFSWLINSLKKTMQYGFFTRYPKLTDDHKWKKFSSQTLWFFFRTDMSLFFIKIAKNRMSSPVTYYICRLAHSDLLHLLAFVMVQLSLPYCPSIFGLLLFPVLLQFSPEQFLFLVFCGWISTIDWLFTFIMCSIQLISVINRASDI